MLSDLQRAALPPELCAFKDSLTATTTHLFPHVARRILPGSPHPHPPPFSASRRKKKNNSILE